MPRRNVFTRPAIISLSLSRARLPGRESDGRPCRVSETLGGVISCAGLWSAALFFFFRSHPKRSWRLISEEECKHTAKGLHPLASILPSALARHSHTKRSQERPLGAGRKERRYDCDKAWGVGERNTQVRSRLGHVQTFYLPRLAREGGVSQASRK